MGYHFAVQTMWPSRHTRAPKEFIFDSLPQEQLPPLEVHPLTVWRPRDTLDVGHVTRIQKLSIPHIAEGIGRHERAGICFAGVITRHIYAWHEALETGEGLVPDLQAIIAPPFYGDARVPFVTDEGLDAHLLTFPSRVDVMDFGDLEYRPALSRLDAFKVSQHNRALELPLEELHARVVGVHPVLTPPVYWAPAWVVRTWFDETEEQDLPEWAELAEHSEARAQYQAWRKFIEALAGTRARMLFLFP